MNTLYARLNVNDGDEIFKSKVRITRPDSDPHFALEDLSTLLSAHVQPGVQGVQIKRKL